MCPESSEVEDLSPSEGLDLRVKQKAGQSVRKLSRDLPLLRVWKSQLRPRSLGLGDLKSDRDAEAEITVSR